MATERKADREAPVTILPSIGHFLAARLARVGAPLRVCLSACVYEPDPARRRLRQMLDSAVAAGTTDFAIAVDRKSVPGTLSWVRSHLRQRRGLLPSVLRPARVVEFDWQDDFAHARNVALDLVSHGCDWWYAIDNDDVLECSEGRRLPEVLVDLPATCRIVCIPYLVPDRNGDMESEAMYETIFRCPVNYRWERAWGEFVKPIDRREGGSINSTALVRRHDRDWTINRQRGANSRNRRIIRAALEADPTDQGLWAFWGQCCTDVLDWKGAAEAWERALSLCQSTRGRLGLIRYLIPVCTILGRTDRALELARLAREWHPERPEPYFFDGRARFMSGDFTGAIEAVQEGLSRLGVVARLEDRLLHSSLPGPPHIYECEPFWLLAECHGQLGNFEEALRNIDVALAGRTHKLIALYLRQLREFFGARECPPFLGVIVQQVFAATSAAIKRLQSYETEAECLADWDTLMPYLTAEHVDLRLVMDFAERHFVERSAAA